MIFNKGKKIADDVKDGKLNSSNQETDNTPKKNNSDLRKQLMKIMFIIVGILVVFLFIILLVVIFSSGKKTYDDVEKIMKDAAVEYYKVQKGLLPQEDGEKVTVNVSTLVDSQFMKPLDELLDDEKCSGRVEVSKVGDQIVYTPYLDCGKNYTTKELYKAVLEQKTVTSGNGLYDLNGEKVYRGEEVNNYVKLDKMLYRIVKVTADNKLLLIMNETSFDYSSVFDDRYNSDRGYNSGFNDYRLSRMFSYLDDLYNNKLDVKILSNNDKEKLVNFDLCIGKRNENDITNTNAVECTDVLADQMIGLLTASDYINASLDSNCMATTDRSCQNYNYLRLKDSDWWLVTADSANTYQVFAVKSNGYIEGFNSSSRKKVRATVMLNNNVMIRSGDGTIDNPFVLK